MFENLTLFKTSHAMARHAGTRQVLVARNMANADTPGYRPSDLVPFAQQFDASATLKASRSSHLNAAPGLLGTEVREVSDATPSPNENAVSLEEEMLRAVDVKRQHDRALAIYKHTLTVLRASLGRK